ncbi:MAG TPA: glycoside hydrolase family 97 protein [Candidatus Heimdallarchaeota archaeon]|nr:glycoside hydrolase family 97 protein [Candidatus Heimdallarchaeota archaeon]
MISHIKFMIMFSLFVLLIGGCVQKEDLNVASPNGKVSVLFELLEGVPHYSVAYSGVGIIDPSSLGFRLEDSEAIGNNLKVIGTVRDVFDQTWKPVWGKRSEIRNYYNQLTVNLQESESPSRKIDVIFRVYDDGVAFRYYFPEQESLTKLAIQSEDTSFTFSDNCTCYALQLGGFTTPYEREFEKILVEDIDSKSIIGLPLLLQTPFCWMAVTEANLTDYAGMYLSPVDENSRTLISKLSPLPGDQDIAVKASVPHNTPWRVIMIGEKPGDLIESDIIENLNEPTTFEDVSWIKPGLVLWPWWNGRLPFGEPHTLQMIHYINFAAKHGIPHLLVDAGWYSLESDAWRNPDAEDILTMEETRKDKYNIEAVIQYAKEKGVDVHLWVHGASLQRQIDEALPVYAKWGAVGIKVDSYGRDDQEWVNFVHEFAQKAASNRLMVNFHGAYKPTGIRVTYPNFMTREGIQGLEHSKWSNKPTPQHNVTIPFTRMLAGPMDYTPGAFDLDGTEESPKQVQGTRTHQLAMYVVYYSPLQMVPDYPEAYEAAPDEFAFIKNIPTVWDDTKVLAGNPGDFIVIARKKGQRWYMGSMTDENPRKLSVPLSFLDQDKKYTAKIYSDALDADKNPEHVIIGDIVVSSSTVLTVAMVGGGGHAVSLEPANGSSESGS